MAGRGGTNNRRKRAQAMPWVQYALGAIGQMMARRAIEARSSGLRAISRRANRSMEF
jgi:hypothetical protein